MNNLDIFFKNNNLDKESVDKIVYESLLLNIFEKIYQYLSDSDNLFEFKKNLRKSNSKEEEMIAFRKIIDKVITINLTDFELSFMSKLIQAYLRKSNKRIIISVEERQKILDEQDSKCNICKSNITIETAHIDHRIPFKYVGDELPNNYQALCNKCNWSKSSNLYYQFDFMLKKQNK